jgi:prephenate dehydrogenase
VLPSLDNGLPEGPRRAQVVGTGLIGGSVGLALHAAGWHVTATDLEASWAERARVLGAVDELGVDPEAMITFLAAPVGRIAELAAEFLDRTAGVVTDVGSTKAAISRAVDHPRFVGGHPMAGSEQDGIDGARGDLFQGATWVLTPTEKTDEHSFTLVRSVVRSFGAEPISLGPEVHDELVALVSHVPHLTAAALMCLADDSAIEHRALLRLAAGGFRDMTRISAGRPAIWPDICVANRPAIVSGLDRLIGELTRIRDRVHGEDRTGLLDLLSRARHARINLPSGYGEAEVLAEVAIPIPDRPGEIAAITTLASELDVNLIDLEITHSSEGRRGVLMVVVDAAIGERLVGGLMAKGYRPTLRPLE